jgi:hypothetical protein
MIVQVESVTGPIGLLEPRAFSLGERRIDVVNIIDRWISAEQNYFKLEAQDGAVYILRHDEHSEVWEMTLFQDIRK